MEAGVELRRVHRLVERKLERVERELVAGALVEAARYGPGVRVVRVVERGFDVAGQFHAEQPRFQVLWRGRRRGRSRHLRRGRIGLQVGWLRNARAGGSDHREEQGSMAD